MPNRKISARNLSRIYALMGQVDPSLSPSQIHERIGGAVGLRTVQRIVKESRPNLADWWRIEDAESPGAAAAVLEVMRDMSELAGGLVGVNKEQAAWIVAVRRAAPDLDSRAVAQIALFYSVTRGHGSTADADVFLAFAPWRSSAHKERYRAAVKRGVQPFFDELEPWLERGLPVDPAEES